MLRVTTHKLGFLYLLICSANPHCNETNEFLNYFFELFFRYPRNQEASLARAMRATLAMDLTVPMLTSVRWTPAMLMLLVPTRPVGTRARATQATPATASLATMLTSVPRHRAVAMPHAQMNKDSGCQMFIYLYSIISLLLLEKIFLFLSTFLKRYLHLL